MLGDLRYIEISQATRLRPCHIRVPASKSESNRALIIQTLAGGGKVLNLSTARDTATMERLLMSTEHKLDVIDAGTTMRFLTAYLAVTGQDKILTGTQRMCERPIEILVDALRKIGANIEYIDRAGYPPLHIRGMDPVDIRKIKMRGDVSSQYISAIMMISPLLENGLTIVLEGKIGSRPYIEMTLGIMKHFGIKAGFSRNKIRIPPQKYKQSTYAVDPDWSGASYWYAIVAMAEESDIFLEGYHLPSYQGDSRITELMAELGVKSLFTKDGLKLIKGRHQKKVRIDFSDIPDLAQTVMVVCAAKGIRAIFTGLESLRIKETDRIEALQNELAKIGTEIAERKTGVWELSPGSPGNFPQTITVSTYEDHRMAMAFAPLATVINVRIENPSVVEKSYPSFWEDMEKAGFNLISR